jgi:hypothetical protein
MNVPRYRNEADLLNLLPSAATAAFNSSDKSHDPLCLPETRVDVLQQIMAWADTSDERCIFWLNGMAGTGKSTIARTIARTYYKQGRLGASFFFSRGGGDVSHCGRFFTTIAVQLADMSAALKRAICEAVARRRNIANQTLHDQWNQLIVEPLSKLEFNSIQSPCILVVDALDECEGENDSRAILQLFTEARSLAGIRLRVLVTSRPETPVRLGFRTMPAMVHYDLVLHDVCRTTIIHDLSIFFRDELGKIRAEFEAEFDWPGDDIINSLVHKADGLFIYAATVCRFIRSNDICLRRDLLKLFASDRSSAHFPEIEPSELPSKTPTSELDEIYMQILNHSQRKVDKERKRQLSMAFKKIVGTIGILSEPLSTTALAKLLAVKKEEITIRLRTLRSVLNVPEDTVSPIRLLHPSFRDFLLDKKRCPDEHFWVDKKESHRILAESCLRLMSGKLKRDICGLRTPDALATEVGSYQAQQCLPPELQYACRYWVEHLRRSETLLYDDGQEHVFLREHLLHWVEALSLIGKTSEGVHAIILLESMVRISYDLRETRLTLLRLMRASFFTALSMTLNVSYYITD